MFTYYYNINKVLNFSRCLLFADDTKIFKKIKCIDDSLELQADLDNIYKWCIYNGMSLNIDKCSVISYSLKKNTILYNYILYNTNVLYINILLKT